MKKLIQGWGESGRSTLPKNPLDKRASDLRALLFKESADDLLQTCADANFLVVHDVNSSQIPFETLSQPDLTPPAVAGGLSRRLLVEDIPASALFARPSNSKRLRVLLVIDPEGKLTNAAAEGKAVEKELESLGERVDLTVLPKELATLEEVRRALSGCDVFHYCGHAFFDKNNPESSGLKLHGDKTLTLKHLDGINVPRIAIVNACESGRMGGPEVKKAASFAEFFLRSGVEAYVGTLWKVGDRSAARFAIKVYVRLTEGDNLQEAVTAARRDLFASGDTTWANYLLYGDGHFRLI